MSARFSSSSVVADGDIGVRRLSKRLRRRVPGRAHAAVFVVVLGTNVGLGDGCMSGNPPRTSPDLKPFIEMARKSECANIRRRLFLIDNALVLFDRAGDCPDNSYSQTLFGERPEDVLCTLHDSIAGPMMQCRDARYQDLFHTITAHLEEPDLGLGSGHGVKQIPL